MKKLLALILGVIILFIVVLTINTIRFTSKQDAVTTVKTIDVDEKAVLSRLSQALQIRTISYEDHTKIDHAPFLEFHELLQQNYSFVHQKLELQVINNYSLLYKWQGSKASLKPVVFLSHMDVVPVEPGTESKWAHDAFSGKIAEDFIWGRGALDMKSTLVSIMEAIEALLRDGYSPQRTIYFALGHDEEIGGENGAKKIAAYLKAKGVQVAFTVDEGMAILNETLSPAKRHTAIIGLAEKGYLTVKITARAKGGHSSMPPSRTTLGVLAKAIIDLEQNQMPVSFSGPAKLLFEYIGPEMPLIQKVLFANLWVSEGVVIKQLEKISSMNAMLRTTTAPTMISGGIKENVLPSQASAIVNFRILPGDTVEDIVAHTKNVIADSDVEVSIKGGMGRNPSPVSSVDTFGFKTIKRCIREVFKDTLVAPGLVIAGTDTRHYTSISDDNYRFFPLILGKDDPKRIHGTNERVGVNNYVKMIKYYVHLLKTTGQIS